jgi:DNA polymerase alpha subunit B
MKQLEKFQYSAKSMNGQPLKLMVAAGPFTSDTDLAFGPFEALIERVLAEPPDVLILLGPFLSRTHPILQSGQIEDFPDAIFRKRVGERLAFLLRETKSAGMRIAIMPSTKDVISAHSAYPQPMFEKDQKDAPAGFFDKRTGIPVSLISAIALSRSFADQLRKLLYARQEDKRLFRLPNPCAVWINECFIGLSTADVLRDIRAEEMVIKVENHKSQADEEYAPDPILRACGHLICQRW